MCNTHNDYAFQQLLMLSRFKMEFRSNVMQAKTRSQHKSELLVVVIALLAFVVGLVGHLAGASIANSDSFGYIAAPVPLIVGLIAVVAYKIAEHGDH